MRRKLKFKKSFIEALDKVFVNREAQKKFFPRPLITNPNAYKWKSTEEAEEYFLGSDPRKHKDYKRLSKK